MIRFITAILYLIFFVGCSQTREQSSVMEAPQNSPLSLNEIYTILTTTYKGIFKNLAYDAVSFLGKNNLQGFKLALLKNYEGNPEKADFDVLEESNKGGFSTYRTVVASKYNGTLDTNVKLNQLYCSNYEAYKNFYGAAGLTDTDSLIPSKGDYENSCKFRFKSRSVFGFRMEYDGQMIHYINPSKTLFIELSYITKAISQVQELTALTVSHTTSDSKIQTYTYVKSVIPASWFFHSTAISEAKKTTKNKLIYNWNFMNSH